jgi:hypothetical protein
MMQIKTKTTGRQKTSRPRLTILLLILGALLLVYVKHQDVFDWVKLHNYSAPAAVAQIATDDTMTPYVRKVFYVNAPALEDKTNFTQCKIGGEQTIVLGCYHGNQSGIFVLDVTDPRLEGVEQVTSAHEMLHAAYDRLSSSERKDIDKQLRDYYNHQLADERVRKTIENYRSFEPDELTNEMHSIFGSEVVDLPPALEQYYQRYFTDRSKVVAFATQYENEFTSRQQAIKSDDDQLSALKKQIDTLKADLTSRQKALEADSARLQQLKSQGNAQAYNAGVPGYNASVNVYNSEIEQSKILIDKYNALVAQRNAIVLEAQQLTNAIDSNVAPIGEK